MKIVIPPLYFPPLPPAEPPISEKEKFNNALAKAVERCFSYNRFVFKNDFNPLNSPVVSRSTATYLQTNLVTPLKVKIKCYLCAPHLVFRSESSQSGDLLPEGVHKKIRMGTLFEVDSKGNILASKPAVLLKPQIESNQEELVKEIHNAYRYQNKPGLAHIYGSFYYRKQILGKKAVKKLRIVMEYYNLGDLYHLLFSKKDPLKEQLSPEDYRSIQLQILEGLIYMHSQGDIHRDIKLQNIFISKAVDSKKVTAVIGDFNAVKKQEEQMIFAGTSSYIAPERASNFLLYNLQLSFLLRLENALPPPQVDHTQIYCYPDQEKNNHLDECNLSTEPAQDLFLDKLSTASDIYSLGLVFALMSGEWGKQLFQAQQELTQKIALLKESPDQLKEKGLEFFVTEPEEKNSFKYLIWRMVRPIAQERITAPEALLFLQCNIK